MTVNTNIISEAKELLRKFDEVTGNSLNQAKEEKNWRVSIYDFLKGYTSKNITLTNNCDVVNDYFKGDLCFKDYEASGDITLSGCGYIYKSNDNKKTFVYPSTISSSRSVVAEQKVDNLFASDYPNNMNVIAVVKDGDAVVENAAVEVYADNSLRGVSNQSVVDNKHFMTIYGDKSAERLTFNVVVDDIIYEVENTISFSEDAVVGTLDNPYIIQLNNDIQIDGINVYPTLLKDVLNISSKENINNVSVYNVNGLEVYRGENYSESTQINLENLNSGTYFVKVMTENGNVKVRCVVKY